MRRREFIAVLGSGAVAWPLAARAQQPAKVPTIGFLGAGTPSADTLWAAAFVQRLRELGWVEGRTVAIEYRWAENRSDRYAEIAVEFVQLKVAVIVTYATAPVIAAKKATSVIPIVFAQPGTRSAAVWSRVWRDRAATSLACRCKRPILLPSESSCCARSSQRSTDWRFWAILTIPSAWRRCPRFWQRPARWASKPRPWKSGEGRTSCPRSRRSRAAPMHFMLLATRSLTPTGFASTFWRWAHDCQRFTFSGRMSKREV